MDTASRQLKEDVWQVLAHLLANNLIWIALVVAVVGVALMILVPVRRWGRDVTVSAVLLFALAIVTHGIAWTPLL